MNYKEFISPPKKKEFISQESQHNLKLVCEQFLKSGTEEPISHKPQEFTINEKHLSILEELPDI